MSLENPAVAYMVADDGNLEPGLVVLPELTCELPGGLTGYFQRSFLDCMRAAVATATQIPYEQVELPEPVNIYGPELVMFALHTGLEMEAVDLEAPPEEPWLALSTAIPGLGGDVHCFVCKGPDLLFDPWGFVRADGAPAGDRPTQATQGIHFYRREPDGPRQ